MASTIDHWVCPQCGYNFQDINNLESEVCETCKIPMEVFICDSIGWGEEDKCYCVETCRKQNKYIVKEA